MQKNKSVIRECVDSGKPIKDVTIVDAHTHLLPGSAANASFLWSSPDEMVISMDRYGIDQACISVIGAVDDENDEMLAALQKYPDRFIGSVLVNPNYSEEIEGEIKRCFKAHPSVRMIGEVHPTSYQHRYPVTGPKYEPLWEYASKFKIPILIHSGPTSEKPLCGPSEIAKIAKAYPDIPILIGHTGGYDSWEMLEESIEVTKKYDNLFQEICAMGRYFGVVEYLVEKLSAERVIFGTDAPFHDWSAEIAHVAYAKISDGDKEKIFGQNILNLLK